MFSYFFLSVILFTALMSASHSQTVEPFICQSVKSSPGEEKVIFFCSLRVISHDNQKSDLMVIFWVTSYIITLFNNHYSLIYQYTCTSSQVTFIYIPLYTLKIVSKQLYSDNMYIAYILKYVQAFSWQTYDIYLACFFLHNLIHSELWW